MGIVGSGRNQADDQMDNSNSLIVNDPSSPDRQDIHV